MKNNDILCNEVAQLFNEINRIDGLDDTYFTGGADEKQDILANLIDDEKLLAITNCAVNNGHISYCGQICKVLKLYKEKVYTGKEVWFVVVSFLNDECHIFTKIDSRNMVSWVSRADLVTCT